MSETSAIMWTADSQIERAVRQPQRFSDGTFSDEVLQKKLSVAEDAQLGVQ